MANINLTKNDSSLKVNLVKGASQVAINSLYTQTKELRDETNELKDIASTKATEASNSAAIALEAIQYLTDLTVAAVEGTTANASYNDATNTLTLTLPKGDKGDTGEQGIQGKGIDTVTSNKIGLTTTVTLTGDFDNSPYSFNIQDGTSSAGDMLKSIYDTDNSGIVDNAKMLSLNTTNTISPALGQVKWNQDEYTADLGLGNVILQLGQEQLVRVRNDNGSLLSNGTVVMATGTLGNSGRILVKPHTGTVALSKTIVGVVTEDIAVGADGFVTTFGKVRGINTTGSAYGETWLDGDILYVKPNGNGSLTKVTPLDNELYMPVAFVIKAHTSGTLFIRINGVDENRNKLISGTSIKTINNTSVLGSGNIDTTQTTITGNAGTATKLRTARTISTTGDVSYTSALFDGSTNVSGTATLSNTGVSAGTYKSVTVDGKGRITNGTNPTTLSGYGITDAQPLLLSGTSIKTINSTSILDSGNLNLVDLTTNQSIGGIKTFTSSPTAPTPTAGDDSTKIATTAFVLANSLQDISFTAGTKLEALAAAEVSIASTTYAKKKEISVSRIGTITVSFRMRASFPPYAAYGQIYVNGVAVGTVRTTTSTAFLTYTENITIAAGDLVQLYLKCGHSDYYTYADTFKILVAEPSTSIVLLN